MVQIASTAGGVFVSGWSVSTRTLTLSSPHLSHYFVALVRCFRSLSEEEGES